MKLSVLSLILGLTVASASSLAQETPDRQRYPALGRIGIVSASGTGLVGDWTDYIFKRKEVRGRIAALRDARVEERIVWKFKSRVEPVVGEIATIEGARPGGTFDTLLLVQTTQELKPVYIMGYGGAYQRPLGCDAGLQTSIALVRPSDKKTLWKVYERADSSMFSGAVAPLVSCQPSETELQKAYEPYTDYIAEHLAKKFLKRLTKLRSD